MTQRVLRWYLVWCPAPQKQYPVSGGGALGCSVVHPVCVGKASRINSLLCVACACGQQTLVLGDPSPLLILATSRLLVST